MVRSMGVVLVFVLGILWLTPRSSGGGAPTIDPAPAVQAARASLPYAVYAPERLPDGWRVTSARSERAEGGARTWHLGLLTPQNRYAAVEQSDGPQDAALQRIGPDQAPRGARTVAGEQWQLRQQGGERTLWRTADGSVLAVAGSAPLADLELLAAALRAQGRAGSALG